MVDPVIRQSLIHLGENMQSLERNGVEPSSTDIFNQLGNEIAYWLRLLIQHEPKPTLSQIMVVLLVAQTKTSDFNELGVDYDEKKHPANGWEQILNDCTIIRAAGNHYTIFHDLSVQKWAPRLLSEIRDDPVSTTRDRLTMSKL